MAVSRHRQQAWTGGMRLYHLHVHRRLPDRRWTCFHLDGRDLSHQHSWQRYRAGVLFVLCRRHHVQHTITPCIQEHVSTFLPNDLLD